MTTQQLMSVVNSRERYDEVKRLLVAARVLRVTPIGPFYQALPRATHPLDRYDPDRTVLGYDLDYFRLYCRMLHASLTGQYDWSGVLPRYASVSMLDKHSVDTYFAPFAPRLSRDLADSCLAPWDRNGTALLPVSRKPVLVDRSALYFGASEARRRLFLSLIPLYLDYHGEGHNSTVNTTGVALDRNTTIIARYLLLFFNSANQYREKLTEVARVEQTRAALERRRTDLVARLAQLQRDKIQQLAQHQQPLSAAQQEILRRFNVVFRQTVQQLSATARGNSRRDNSGGGGRAAR